MAETAPAAELVGAGRVFADGTGVTTALHPTSLRVFPGELVLVVGPSGSGKTTLLSLLGCVLTPSQGEVHVAGVCTATLDAAALAALRLRKVGFVFQGGNLVAPLSARANVELPMLLAGVGRSERRARAREALARMGLGHREEALPRTLSGGEQQRVAVARALANDPALLLCDEPTAALDPEAAARTMAELRARADDGRAVVVVTHDLRWVKFADRRVEVSDGRLVPHTAGAHPAHHEAGV